MTKEEALSYLKFEDWIARNEHEKSDWVVVARHIPEGFPRPFTVSVLLPDTEENIEKRFSSPSWGFGAEDLGKPTYGLRGDEPVYYSDSAGMNFLPVKAFTVFRSATAIRPSSFELRQEFVMYHDAHYDADRDQWIALDEAGQDIVVARRFERENAECGIEVSTHATRDFLTSGPWLLVRCHDHSRSTERLELPDDETFIEEHIQDDGERFYEIWVRNDISDDATMSTLLGFDIVRAYSEVPKSRRWWDPERREYEEFIIGIDEAGNNLLHTCDSRELIGLYSQTDGVQGLTPVYFKADVLDKYRDDTDRYGGEPGVFGIWGLDYEINDEGLVQVWLKDLGDIPHSEQQHWRAFNVPPAGGVPEERIARDFRLEPMPSRSPAERFHEAYHKLTEVSEDRLGFAIFRPLREDDQHSLVEVSWPIANRLNMLDRQTKCLAKVLPDSTNVRELTQITGLSKDDDNIKGSLDLLEQALIESGCTGDEVQVTVQPLRQLQALRSTGAVHRRGGNYDKALKRSGLAGKPPEQVHSQLLERLTDALQCLARLIDSGTLGPPAPDERPSAARQAGEEAQGQ